jgi:hypothetical protein
LPLLLANKNRTHLGVVAEERTLPSLREIWQMSSTFALTVLAWVFFRAENMAHAFSYLKGIFSKSLFTLPKESHFIDTNLHPLIMFFLLGIFIMFEWFGRRQQYAIEIIGLSWKRPFRYVFYYILIIFIFLFGGQAQEFIYFQF